MGDMADDLTDNEMDYLGAHDRGECEGPCQYCEADEARGRVVELFDALNSSKRRPPRSGRRDGGPA